MECRTSSRSEDFRTIQSPPRTRTVWVEHRIIDLPIPRDPSSVGAGVSRACSVTAPRRLEWITAASFCCSANAGRVRMSARRIGRARVSLPTLIGTGAVADNRPTGEGPRILVVDDNDDNRYTLTLYLDLEGYTNVETAHDGEEAIARLETRQLRSCPARRDDAEGRRLSGAHLAEGSGRGCATFP